MLIYRRVIDDNYLVIAIDTDWQASWWIGMPGGFVWQSRSAGFSTSYIFLWKQNRFLVANRNNNTRSWSDANHPRLIMVTMEISNDPCCLSPFKLNHHQWWTVWEASGACLISWCDKNTRLFLATTWWLIPLSKWVITPVINGLTLLIPLITGVITHLRAVGWATKYQTNSYWRHINQHTDSVFPGQSSLQKFTDNTIWLWLTVCHGIDGPFIDGLPRDMCSFHCNISTSWWSLLMIPSISTISNNQRVIIMNILWIYDLQNGMCRYRLPFLWC